MGWAEERALECRLAASYLLSMFKALSEQAGLTDPSKLSTLWEEMTPGEMNEDAIRIVRDSGGFDCWLKAATAVRERMG